MRIVFVIPDMSPGGAQLALLRLLERWEGSPAQILTFRDVEVPAGRPPSTISSISLASTARGLIGRLVTLRRLRSFLVEERPDMVVSVLANAHWAVGLASWGLGLRWVAWEQCYLSDYVRQSRYPRIWRFLLRGAFPKAAAFVAASRGVAEDLQRNWTVPLERIEIVANVGPAPSDSAAAPMPHPWFEDGVPTFLYAGRFEHQKNLQFLLRAFARAREKAPMRLLLLGAGTQERELRDLRGRLGLEGAVAFRGWVDDVRPFLRPAVGLLLPSHWEGYSNATAEALSCGTPVIAARCVGPDELLRHGRCGLLLPVDDEDAWSAGLVRLATEPALRRRLGRRGLARSRALRPEKVMPLMRRALMGPLERHSSTGGMLQ